MGNDLLFGCPGHAVTGRQSQERAFVRRETGTRVTFDDAGKLFAQPPFTNKISPALGVPDIVGPAPADIMEHRSLFHEMKTDAGLTGCIPAGTVPDCPRVGDNPNAAPGVAQQVLAPFFPGFRHGPATF